MTIIYNRMILSTLIKASEISDLGNLIRNELIRRNKIPSAVENSAIIGNSALASTINTFYSDLISVDSSAAISQVIKNNKIEKAIVEKYIDKVKQLYTTQISK